MEPNGKPFDGREYLLPAVCKDPGKASCVVTIKTVPSHQKQARRFLRKQAKKTRVVYLPSQVVVKDLATAVGAKLYQVIKLLKQMKVFTSVNQKVSFYTAAIVAKKYGFAAKRKIRAF